MATIWAATGEGPGEGVGMAPGGPWRRKGPGKGRGCGTPKGGPKVMDGLLEK